jgi:hypothetical protein
VKCIGRSDSDVKALRVLVENLNNRSKIIKALDAIRSTWSADENLKAIDVEKLRIFFDNDRIKEKLFDGMKFQNPSGDASDSLLKFLIAQTAKINPEYLGYDWGFKISEQGDENMTEVQKVLYAADNFTPSGLKRTMDSVPLRVIGRAANKANEGQRVRMREVANKHQKPLI